MRKVCESTTKGTQYKLVAVCRPTVVALKLSKVPKEGTVSTGSHFIVGVFAHLLNRPIVVVVGQFIVHVTSREFWLAVDFDCAIVTKTCKERRDMRTSTVS